MIPVDGDVVHSVDGSVDIKERVALCSHGIVDRAIDLVRERVYGRRERYP